MTPRLAARAWTWLALGVVLFSLRTVYGGPPVRPVPSEAGRSPSVETTGSAAPQPSHYVLIGVPGSDSDTDDSGVSVLVFAPDRQHRFVTRMPIWPGDEGPERVRGITLSPPDATASMAGHGPRLYISTTRRLGAIDLGTGDVIWEQEYDRDCCERVAVSPDGHTLYVPAIGKARWYVLDAATGVVKTTVPVLGWPRSTALSPAGDRVFLAAWESRELLVLDTASNEIVGSVGPFSDYVCPFTTNQDATMAYANVDGLVGFEIGDLLTGLVIERIQIDDYTGEQLGAYECPSHGIAFAPGDKELWIADGIGNQLRVFDSRPLPPVHMTTIPLDRQPRWITFGRAGRYVYSSTGDVIDAESRQIVATLRDEDGRIVDSERMVDISMAVPPPGWRR